MDVRETIWFQKHRPKTIDDCILPADLKDLFKKFVAKGDIPNLIFSGPSGVGKTTVARAMLEEMGLEYYFINASLSGNIDTLRNEITQWASSVSFNGKRRFIILDEADHLTGATQAALRGFMEEFSMSSGFLLTCNALPRIVEPIQGRCAIVHFTVPDSEKNDMLKATAQAMFNVLDMEGVDYDPKAVVKLVKGLFPDVRRIVNELQRHASRGPIDDGVLASLRDGKMEELVGALKRGKFNDMRKWVTDNADVEFNVLCERLYGAIVNVAQPESIPAAIMILNRHDYQHSFVANRELNLVAMLTSLMIEVQFK